MAESKLVGVPQFQKYISTNLHQIPFFSSFAFNPPQKYISTTLLHAARTDLEPLVLGKISKYSVFSENPRISHEIPFGIDKSLGLAATIRQLGVNSLLKPIRGGCQFSGQVSEIVCTYTALEILLEAN